MNGFLRGLALTLLCTMGIAWGEETFDHNLYFFKNKNNELCIVYYKGQQNKNTIRISSDTQKYVLKTHYSFPGKYQEATFEEIEKFTSPAGETLTLYLLKPNEWHLIEDILNVDHGHLKFTELNDFLTRDDTNSYDKKFFQKSDYSPIKNNQHIVEEAVKNYFEKIDLQAKKSIDDLFNLLKDNITQSIFNKSLESRKSARSDTLKNINTLALTERSQLLKHAKEQKQLFVKKNKNAPTSLIKAIDSFISALYQKAKTDESKKIDDKFKGIISNYNLEIPAARKLQKEKMESLLQELDSFTLEDKEELAKYTQAELNKFIEDNSVSPEQVKKIDDFIDQINPTKTKTQKTIEKYIYEGINNEESATRKKSRTLALEKIAAIKEQTEKTALIKYAKKQEQLYLEKYEDTAKELRLKNISTFIKELGEAAKTELRKEIEKAIYEGINNKESTTRKKSRTLALEKIADIKKQAEKNALIKYAKKQKKLFARANKNAPKKRLNVIEEFVKEFEEAAKKVSES